MYDRIKDHNRKAKASEWSLTFMWLAVGAVLGAFGGLTWAIVFGICFLFGIAYLVHIR